MLSYDDALDRAQSIVTDRRFYPKDWNDLEDELSTYSHDQINAIVAQAMTEHRARFFDGAMVLMTMAEYILNPSK